MCGEDHIGEGKRREKGREREKGERRKHPKRSQPFVPQIQDQVPSEETKCTGKGKAE